MRQKLLISSNKTAGVATYQEDGCMIFIIYSTWSTALWVNIDQVHCGYPAVGKNRQKIPFFSKNFELSEALAPKLMRPVGQHSSF